MDALAFGFTSVRLCTVRFGGLEKCHTVAMLTDTTVGASHMVGREADLRPAVDRRVDHDEDRVRRALASPGE
jgi:hypothetical protein